MNASKKGSCMCGAIRFSWSGDPRFVSECVCESCRRAHGASVVGWVGVKNAQFSLDEGEALLKWYRSSTDSERGFCASCGTRILFRSDRWAGEMHMALACMEPPHGLMSSGVSFAGELPEWTAVAITKTVGP